MNASIECVWEMHRRKTNEKMLILTPQISKSRLRRFQLHVNYWLIIYIYIELCAQGAYILNFYTNINRIHLRFHEVS